MENLKRVVIIICLINLIVPLTSGANITNADEVTTTEMKSIDLPSTTLKSNINLNSEVTTPQEKIETSSILSVNKNDSSSNSSGSSNETISTTETNLIPPAHVEPNIAQMNTTSIFENGVGPIIIASDDCPSLKDADNLSQTQLLQRLTHECRYDRLERPISHNKSSERVPVNVYARAYIYFLQNLEAHDLQFTLHVLLQLRFVDPRLAFKQVAPKRQQPIIGEKSLREKLWVPHIFLANERDSEILGTPEKDILTSISPDGTVIVSTRIRATLYCWMNLQKFPFDEQHCSTTLESWMYNTSELVLHWEEKSPVTLAHELHLTEYVLLNIWSNESTINANLSDLRHGAFAGNYSSLSFTVHLAREMGFYLMDYFLPSMMIVAISWVSFWLQADQSAPRIMLGTSTMLTFITLASAQGKTLPKVSYIKVSEVWFLGCTGFIFGSLVEFAFVNTIWRRKKNVELKKVNSKYILKSTLTPRPARKDISFQKSRSCSSLDGSCDDTKSTHHTYNNYLTVHGFPSNATLPIITTQSADDLIQSSNGTIINMEPLGQTRESHTLNQDYSPCPTPLHHRSIELKFNNEKNNNSGPNMNDIDKNNKNGWTTMTPQEISMWIDRRSRYVFPCAFFVFNIFFWTFVYYL